MRVFNLICFLATSPALAVSAAAQDFSALCSCAKEQYRLRDWPRFFALSKQLLVKFPTAQADDVRFLEVAALIRHCHWTQAADRLRQLQETHASPALLARFSGLLMHRPTFTAPTAKNAFNYWLPVTFRWPVPTEEIGALDSNHIRVRVVSHCDRPKAPLPGSLPDFINDPWSLLLAALWGNQQALLLVNTPRMEKNAVYQAYRYHALSRSNGGGLRDLDAMIRKLTAGKDPDASLHDSTLQRVLRLRADEWYRSGDFDLAAHAYRALLVSAEEPVKSYLLLKLGWTYMNKGQPKEALEVWTAVLQKTQISGFVRGAAQALAESGNRTQAEIDQVFASVRGPDSELELIEGIADGALELETQHDLDHLHSQIAGRSLFNAIREAIFRRSGRSAAKTCKLLPWLKDGSSLGSDPDGDYVVSCMRWLTADTGAAARMHHLSTVLKLLLRCNPKPRNRSAVIEFLGTFGKAEIACRQGLEWSVETPQDGDLARGTVGACETVPVAFVLKAIVETFHLKGGTLRKPRCSAENLSVWGRYLSMVLRRGANLDSFPTLATAECLQNAPPSEAEPWLTLLVSAKQWNVFWGLLSSESVWARLNKKVRDGFLRQAFTAMMAGFIPSPSSHPKLEWVRITAQRILEKNSAALVSDDSDNPDLSLRKDLGVAQQIYRWKTHTAARTSKQTDAVRGLEGWLEFLHRAHRKIRSYEWHDGSFARFAEHVVAMGCSEAASWVHNLPDPAMRAGVERKLDDCFKGDPWS